MRSGSKIRLKKTIFSQISCCQITFQQQAIYESDFLKSSFIWMHITRSTTYLLPWPPHWIIKMANHDMCDGKCHPSQMWMLHFFLEDIPHLNYQQNIRECFDTIVNIRGGHAPGHHELRTRFSKCNLLWLILQIGNFLRYSRDILYISLSKVQWVMCPWPLNSYGKELRSQCINHICILVYSCL